MRANHPALRVGEAVFARQPFRLIKGLVSAYLAYPVAERREMRLIRPKLAELRRHYRMTFPERLSMARERLADTLCFAQSSVPYYRDLFAASGFDPERVRRDTGYLGDLPYLTKDIIREQGERLLSRPLAELRHHACKTGGSTGVSTVIYYDQEAADYSAAVTLYARERIGKKKYKPELHFACRFPDPDVPEWPTREDWKCFAMNRSNIFFDRIDDVGLEEIWRKLKRRRPYLVHEHPSTIYALACYIEQRYGSGKAFDVFESSGELLQPYMREKIAKALRCRVVDRYGLAELGVMAYELDGDSGGLQALDSEGWPESREIEDGHELVFTGFRNRLMPLIRYATGDRARVSQADNAFLLTDVVGRIHDVVPINGVAHATHHIMDMLDHRVGGIQEFQIDLRTAHPVLRIVPEPHADPGHISARIETFWPGAFLIEYVGHDALVRVGHRAKFRHVVTA
ncbi:CoF synthetase [Dechloromonas denitrificans]|uniref:CoF synthetase n=1 Tax=Dechloromonas denitrificans TaxID=281362 RepID=A0A133XI44_9RHOO|nr:CoF synthetase [Dechloromonas denitrificans]